MTAIAHKLKAVNIKTSKSIVLGKEALNKINELRAEHGSSDINKLPITLKQFVETTNVMSYRDNDNGMVELGMSFMNDGCPSHTDLPGFGVTVTSNNSNLTIDGDFALLNIDVSMKAGSSKREKEYFNLISNALVQDEVYFELGYRSSESVDERGYSKGLEAENADIEKCECKYISKNFIVADFNSPAKKG
jgi:hypothetical protein